MTGKAALLFAKVSSVNAQIEGMKTENAYCTSNGNAPTFGYEAFNDECERIDAAIAEFQKTVSPACVICGLPLTPPEMKIRLTEAPGFICRSCYAQKVETRKMAQQPTASIIPGEPPQEPLGKCEACEAEVFDGDGHSSDAESGYLCKTCFEDEQKREEIFRQVRSSCKEVSPTNGYLCFPQSLKQNIEICCDSDHCPLVAEALQSIEDAKMEASKA